MIYKGIEKGDSNYRKFTYDDNDVIEKNGVRFYKVNYGKNPLEGETGEDEYGYVACDNILPIGGKKPQPKPVSQPEPIINKVEEPQPEPVSKPKTKAKAKTTKTSKSKTTKVENIQKVSEENQDTYQVLIGSDKNVFEYKVIEFKTSNVDTLQSQLNELGEEGWEMCGFDTNKSLFGDIQMISVFKRKKG